MLKTVFKNQFFLFLKTVLRALETSFKELTTCSIDFLLFFIEIEIIKANENYINISHENYKTVVLKQAMDELKETSNFNLVPTSFSPSSYSEKMRWGRG